MGPVMWKNTSRSQCSSVRHKLVPPAYACMVSYERDATTGEDMNSFQPRAMALVMHLRLQVVTLQ